jgi:hypothetical protein
LCSLNELGGGLRGIANRVDFIGLELELEPRCGLLGDFKRWITCQLLLYSDAWRNTDAVVLQCPVLASSGQ